ncbi:hypothetical protein ACQP2K_35515 [Microbispora siamensis]
MAKFNTGTARAATFSPVTTETVPGGRTHEGAPGYLRDARSELFVLAVSNMVGENTFYERAGDRDDRFRALVHRVAVEDGDWMARLRGEANMRSASLVAALEAVRARLSAGLHGGNRELVASVLQRADEPGEALGYWTSRYGRAVPKPVKRGIADAVRRLYTERSLVKYDSDARGFRFGDVIELVHPTPADDRRAWQGATCSPTRSTGAASATSRSRRRCGRCATGPRCSLSRWASAGRYWPRQSVSPPPA